MSDIIRNLIEAIYKRPIDVIVQFLFVALIFYITYIALWVACPCA